MGRAPRHRVLTGAPARRPQCGKSGRLSHEARVEERTPRNSPMKCSQRSTALAGGRRRNRHMLPGGHIVLFRWRRERSVPELRFASPERRLRAASALVIAALIGWFAVRSIRLSRHLAPPILLPLPVQIAVTCTAVAVGAAVAIMIMRTHLSVNSEGLADHRLLRTVRVPWKQISGFDIGRPGGLWGGMCLRAVCRDEETVDLLSTRAYSRVPSAWHLDELERIRWSLEEAAKRYAD